VPEVAEPMSLTDVAGRIGEFAAAFVAWEQESAGALALVMDRASELARSANGPG